MKSQIDFSIKINKQVITVIKQLTANSLKIDYLFHKYLIRNFIISAKLNFENYRLGTER